jgi:hypothetical protein
VGRARAEARARREARPPRRVPVGVAAAGAGRSVNAREGIEPSTCWLSPAEFGHHHTTPPVSGRSAAQGNGRTTRSLAVLKPPSAD